MVGICILNMLVLDEILLVLILTYGSVMEEEERSRIRAVQMDNLRGLLGILRMDRVPNARIRQLCGVTKGADEKIDEGVLGLLRESMFEILLVVISG